MVQFIKDAKLWARTIFGRVSFGDKRLTKRLVTYAADQSEQPQATTNAACKGNDAKAVGAYRLLGNEKVTPEKIKEGVYLATDEDCLGKELILALEDTTDLTFLRNTERKLPEGKVREKKPVRSCYQHSVIAVDGQSEAPIGLLYQKLWGRKRKKTSRKKRAYKKKESYKWQEASVAISKRLETMENLVSVCDRESDIFEYMQYKLSRNQRFVVRAAQNRRVMVNGQWGTLFEKIQDFPTLCENTIEIPQSKDQVARVATLEISSGHILIGRGSAYPKCSPLSLGAIHVKEISPPEGQKALEWVLLTGESLKDVGDVLKVVNWYRLRYLIEEFHKVLKTGCAAEKRKLQSHARMDVLIAILLPIAIRILQLRSVTKLDPEQSCTVFFSKMEWKYLWVEEKKQTEFKQFGKRRRMPRKPPSLGWALQSMARLAGWRDTKRDGRIGWIKLYEGWQHLQALLRGGEIYSRIKG